MQLIPIGYGNAVSASRLVAVVSPESAPIKRIIQDARDRGMLRSCYGQRPCYPLRFIACVHFRPCRGHGGR